MEESSRKSWKKTKYKENVQCVAFYETNVFKEKHEYELEITEIKKQVQSWKCSSVDSILVQQHEALGSVSSTTKLVGRDRRVRS